MCCKILAAIFSTGSSRRNVTLSLALAHTKFDFDFVFSFMEVSQQQHSTIYRTAIISTIMHAIAYLLRMSKFCITEQIAILKNCESLNTIRYRKFD